MAVFAWIAARLGISGLKLAMYGALLLTVVIGFASFVSYERAIGRRDALQKIEDANEKARERANVGQKDVDDCILGGGSWDRARGVCKP